MAATQQKGMGLLKFKSLKSSGELEFLPASGEEWDCVSGVGVSGLRGGHSWVMFFISKEEGKEEEEGEERGRRTRRGRRKSERKVGKEGEEEEPASCCWYCKKPKWGCFLPSVWNFMNEL